MPGVTSRFAFDYDNSDVERDLWELEVQIDAPTVGLTAPFKMGAKVIQHELINSTTNAWQTWIFPTGLSGQPDPQWIYPSDGDVTPQNMSSIQLGGCADVKSTTSPRRFSATTTSSTHPSPGTGSPTVRSRPTCRRIFLRTSASTIHRIQRPQRRGFTEHRHRAVQDQAVWLRIRIPRRAGDAIAGPEFHTIGPAADGVVRLAPHAYSLLANRGPHR